MRLFSILSVVVIGIAAVTSSGCLADQIPLTSEQIFPSTSAKRVVTPEFTKHVKQLMGTGKIPGLTLGIVHPDGQVEFGAWGSKTEEFDNMTTDTLFTLASCSKAFLASTVGILMDDFAEGRNVTPLPDGVKTFDWQTKVKDLLPGDWQLDDEWATEKANIRDILSHVSGLSRHDYSYASGDTPLDVIRRMRHLRTSFELRQRWSYNNQMYMLGAHLVSTYSGTPYTQFIKERIFEPLEMTSTTFFESETSGKLTQTWTKTGRRIPFWFSDDEVVRLKAGPGGIISSVEDMVKWLSMLIHSGVNPSTKETVLPKSVVEEITTAHAIIPGSGRNSSLPSIVGYGMGWIRTSAVTGHEAVFHTGGIPGFSTIVGFIPNDNVGVVILSNADEKGREVQSLMYHVFEDLLGLEHEASIRELEDEEDTLISSQATSPLTLSLEDYAGTYTNPGYGNETLCSPQSKSSHCTSVLQTFAPFENFTSSPPTLYASHKSIWASHLRIKHEFADNFNVVLTYLFPEGYGKDTSAFETWETGEGEARAMFVVDRSGGKARVVGFGLFGLGSPGEVTERERIGGNVEETADAWFVKIKDFE